jgi:haloalkane dehalogenase
VSDVLFRALGFPLRSLHKVQGDARSISGEVARAYRFPLRGLANNVAPLALARMVPNQPTHPSMEPLARCQAFFESFAGSVEVVWGERDPILGRVLSWIEKLKPQARVTRTPAGHFLQEEEPQAIAAAIRAVASTSS